MQAAEALEAQAAAEERAAREHLKRLQALCVYIYIYRERELCMCIYSIV